MTDDVPLQGTFPRQTTNARSTTSAKTSARFRAMLSPRGKTSTSTSSRNGNCSMLSGKQQRRQCLRPWHL